MSEELKRRRFVKQGALLGGSWFLVPSGAAEASKPGNATLETLHGLRTTHGNFSKTEISDAEIEQVLAASLRAANASNTQSYSIVVVQDRKTMKEVCGYAGSRLLLYCVDYTRMKSTAAQLGHSYHPDNIVSFVTSGINAAIAAQTAVVAARSLGMDTLLTNGIHRGNMERVWELLELPTSHCFPLIALVLGYATEEPKHKKGRLDGVGVVHRERYHTLTDEETRGIVARYDDEEQHLGFNDGWRAAGHEHYLDWLFTTWLGRSSKPTSEATQMLELLQRAGFVETQRG